VLVPDYEVDGVLWLNNHCAGGYIFREKINLEAIPSQADDGLWELRYGFEYHTKPRHENGRAYRSGGHLTVPKSRGQVSKQP
jgi:hypothetical protein